MEWPHSVRLPETGHSSGVEDFSTLDIGQIDEIPPCDLRVTPIELTGCAGMAFQYTAVVRALRTRAQKK
jgi:hypothetical protein